MRKLILAAAAILLVSSMSWTANAATTAPVSAIPNAARNYSPNSRSRLPRLGPLVRTGLCESLWSVSMLVPSLLVRQVKEGHRIPVAFFIFGANIPYSF